MVDRSTGNVHLLFFTDLKQPLQDLLVAKFGIAEDGASTLYRLNDLIGHVAR
jgi:hypothetical protein